MATHVMEFLNPEYHVGFNSTVRRGDKWLKVRPGDVLEIKQTGQEHVITNATVISVLLVPFDWIPNYYLTIHHDPYCRNMYGLYKMVQAAYEGFRRDEIVCVVVFAI